MNELREELNKIFGVKENEYKEVIKGLRTESAENFELANTYSQKCARSYKKTLILLKRIVCLKSKSRILITEMIIDQNINN